MNRISRSLIVIASVAILSSFALAYSGGDGTAGNPYQIANVADFMQLSATPTDWSRAFILTADIVLDPNNNPAHVFTQAPIAPSSSSTFTGIFDGNGHTISNLTIAASSKNYVGLFGYVGTGGQIKNLGVKKTVILGNYSVGGLAGLNYGTITSCYATGSVGGPVGSQFVGGLVGLSYGTIMSSFATVAIDGYANCAGGLVGQNYSGTIASCFATGSVQGSLNVGGLAGNIISGSITTCYSTGAVSSTNGSVGGLVGSGSSTVTNCFWDTQTSGRATSAGGTGKTTAEMKTLSTFTNAGWSFIYGSNTVGDWIMPDNGYPKLAWEVYSPVTLPNLKGLTEEEARTLLESKGLLVNDSYFVYDVSITAGLVSDTYPKQGSLVYAGLTPVHILLARVSRYSGGDGITNPFEIRNIGDFLDVVNNPPDWNRSFVLLGDIVLTGQSFTQAPIAPSSSSTFTGIFDGNGHTISNLTIAASSKNYVGLLGYVGTGGQIKNLGVENITIQGRDYVGGLAGLSYGTITSCYTSGSVRGSSYVGGLIGACDTGVIGTATITIQECYSMASVTGASNSAFIGGLAGRIINLYYPSNITIRNCYAQGTVAAGSNSLGTGGLLGGMDSLSTAALINCYSSGYVNAGAGSQYVGGLVGTGVSSCTACFWDTETSGKTSSGGGRGLTTSQMKSMNIYQAAGWGNGLWVINDGADYPRLAWENTGGVEIPAPQPIPLAGSGSQEDPYQVLSGADFALLSWYTSVLDKHIALMADLDLSGVSIYPIGDLGTFTGTFDGTFHIIRNAAINRPGSNNVGLFGAIGSGSAILNLGIESISLTGAQYVGALAAYNSGGTVQNCYATGSVSGTASIGGLVGYNNSGNISTCYAIVATSGDTTSNGGLIGTYSGGTVSYCYSAGAVGRTTPGGGLIGTSVSPAIIQGCVWDKTTSGQIWSDGGKGLTSSQMKSLTLYQNFGWADHGWTINDETDYPRLAWQNMPGVSIPAAGPVPLAGDGNEANPFVVVTPADLDVLNWHAAVLDKHIRLDGNLDLGGIAFAPIGELGPFTGAFDGNGHTISNLDVNIPSMSFVGLFGTIRDSASISNLTIASAKINGNKYCGTAAGYSISASLSNCRISGSVKGGSYCGGLAGRSSSSSIQRCVSSSTITGGSSGTGGMIGYSQDDTVRNCRAEGTVSAGSTSFYTGGLIGYCSDGIINNCYATGNVTGNSSSGGLIGDSFLGEVSNCGASGNVSGGTWVGGLIGNGHAELVYSCHALGNVTGGSQSGGLIGSCSVEVLRDCYARGNVSGSSSVGGLIGNEPFSKTIDNCYSTGAVTATSSTTVGGLIGNNNGITANCFWNIETSGKTKGVGSGSSTGVAGKITAEMKMLATFGAWDFTNETANGTDDIWRMCVDGVDYPRLNWEYAINGDFVCPDGVRMEDFGFLAGHWMETTSEADLSGDGVVDMADLVMFGEHWMAGI